MRIGEVIGTVTLSRSHPSLTSARFTLVVPLSMENLTGADSVMGEELTVYDDLGAGLGGRIAFSEGGEAAQPFQPELKPIDAYNAAILDQLNIDTNSNQ